MRRPHEPCCMIWLCLVLCLFFCKASAAPLREPTTYAVWLVDGNQIEAISSCPEYGQEIVDCHEKEVMIDAVPVSETTTLENDIHDERPE